ncbi:hypothetical protein FACS1894201_01890 [Bacteroidia bacterium]|nr:hypothetical protein FACS1894201_01890 [Bacteroidia bacterium]
MSTMNLRHPILQIIWSWLKQGYQTSLYMFRFMIPITIIVKVLQETGLIDYVGMALAPMMELMGLPGEMGLVWASTMIANIYGGIIAFFSIVASAPLNIAQITTLTLVMLIAHTFPIELMVAKKAGVKFVFIFLWRFVFAFVAGILLHQIYQLTGTLQDAPTAIQLFETPENQTYGQWALHEAKNYGFIAVWITALIIIIDILKRIKVIDFINRILSPLLKILGIGNDAIPIIVVGMTLGLAYGGGLIINEVKQGRLSKKDVFYSLALLSLCHSLIEDSLLMISIGGHYTGVFIFRIIFMFIVMFGLVKLTSAWSETKMAKWFYTNID